VPFAGFNRVAVTSAYNSYQGMGTDKNTYLIDLGAASEQGISQPGIATWMSGDGVHPLAWIDGHFGAMLTYNVAFLVANRTMG